MKKRLDVNRFRGAIMGAVVGDAMGMPYQFLHPQVVREAFPAPSAMYQKAPDGHVNAMLDRGHYTDETQLLTIVSEAILEKGTVDPAEVAKGMLRLYGEESWITPGRSIMACCRRMHEGVPWHEAGGRQDGSKPLAFVPPVVLFLFRDPQEIVRRSQDLAKIILREPRVLTGCACFGLLLRQVLQCRDREELPGIVQKVGQELRPVDPSFEEILNWVLSLLPLSVEEGLVELGTGYSILESLFAALYAFLKNPDDYGEAVSNAVYAGDASDSVGFLTGAFLGAFKGEEAIPRELRENVKDAKFFSELCDRLYSVSSVS